MKASIAKIFLSVLFAPFGVFCLVWTGILISRDELPSALVSFGFAIFALGFVAMLAVVATHTVKPRITVDSGGLLLRPDRRVDHLLAASMVGAFMGMLTYAVCAPFDLIVIVVPRNDERYFVIASALGVVVGIFGLRQILRRGGTSYLRLTTDELEVGNTMTSVRLPWAAVTDILDRPQKATRSTGTTYIATPDRRITELPSDWYAPNGRALRELLRFYWKHTGAREELVDRRAIDRFADLYEACA